MAEKESIYEQKDIIEPVPEELEKLEKVEKPEVITKEVEDSKKYLLAWIPRTELGKSVKTGKEKDIDKILEKGKKILEPEIVDSLLNLSSELILIGQAKGKFGGGKRRAWRQTQKKTQEGNVVSFSTMIVIGDKAGHIGVGYGSAKETLPARGKALRHAKLNIIKITRGFEDPLDSAKSDPHTVPFKVEGKSGGSRIILIPAPRGTGLVVANECKKVLKLAGIKDVYSKTQGDTRTTFNLIKACIDALEKTNKMEL